MPKKTSASRPILINYRSRIISSSSASGNTSLPARKFIYILNWGKQKPAAVTAGRLVTFSACWLTQLITHIVPELSLHVAALIIFFHTAINTPQEQRPNAKAKGIQQHGRFRIQGAHKCARRNKTGKYQINKRFHYGKMIRFITKQPRANWSKYPHVLYLKILNL